MIDPSTIEIASPFDRSPQHAELLLQRVLRLTRSQTNELGFIPRAGVRRHATTGRLLTAHLSNEFAGFILFGGRGTVGRVFQVCTVERLRRNGVATALVTSAVRASAKMERQSITCKVRASLPAVEFWRAIGWEQKESRLAGDRRGGYLLRFELDLS